MILRLETILSSGKQELLMVNERLFMNVRSETAKLPQDNSQVSLRYPYRSTWAYFPFFPYFERFLNSPVMPK